MLKYRKTSQGEWVAFGPAAEFPSGPFGNDTIITVGKADGTRKSERLASVGKVFTAGGVQCRYGYLDKDYRDPAARPGRTVQPARPRMSAWGRAMGLGEPEDGDGYTRSERAAMGR